MVLDDGSIGLIDFGQVIFFELLSVSFFILS